MRGVPNHIRSDNGPEFTAKALRAWLITVGARTPYIEPGSPWENGDGQVGHDALEALVLSLQFLQLAGLVALQAAIILAPALVDDIRDARILAGFVICRKIATDCSGLYCLFAICWSTRPGISGK
jgi:transposase InsO family protein